MTSVEDRCAPLLEKRFSVRILRDVRVPVAEGVTLAIDLFLPEGDGPFPVAFDYYPYRKADFGPKSLTGHLYFAERGIAAARVDIRGCGNSTGSPPTDEYSLEEVDDAVRTIEWFARQSWCNGNVGMFGGSYAAVDALLVASRRPPALKAICPMYFTDRRYTDDCHFEGGAMQMLFPTAEYGLSLLCTMLLPSDPVVTGADWSAEWDKRLAHEPWLLRWLDHPTEDEQWKRGSIAFDYSAIRCATFLIGGWRDGYVNCNLRTFEGLACPKKLLIGPWVHVTPYFGTPGPRVDHFREMTRFWLQWLGGVETGIMAEPPISIYVQKYDPPSMVRAETSGFWRYEESWPIERSREKALHLAEDVLQNEPASVSAWAELTYDPTVGASFGPVAVAGPPFLVPGDQREDDARSRVYTSAPLTSPLEILGRARALLEMRFDVPLMNVVVRLCDVAPDGSSALVAKGVLNATHRRSHESPSVLEPGKEESIEVELDATSWLFEPGHRVRLSVLNADFPNTWPSPLPGRCGVRQGGEAGSRLILPIVSDEGGVSRVPSLVTIPPEPVRESASPSWTLTRDLARGSATIVMADAAGGTVGPGMTQQVRGETRVTVSTRTPELATVAAFQEATYDWPVGKIEVRTRSSVTSDAKAFHVTLHAEVELDGMPRYQRKWTKSVGRRFL